MAPPISNTSAEPTLYDILSLTPKHLEGQAGIAQQQKIVKQAYHRALLKHHPDKSASGNTPQGSRTSTPTHSTSTSSKPGPKQTSQPRITYTVDQIQYAYAVLSDRKQRTDYDRALRTAPSQRHSQSASSSFQTGVETVDLDDLAFDERTGVYYRSCRCGNARGYAFTEDNLEEFEDDGVLMVECLDCSLWIRVLFAAAEDDEDDDGGDGGGDVIVTTTTTAAATTSPARNANTTVREAAVTLTMGRGTDAVTSAGERRGSGTGRNYTFNWSFNWGISLSGSATAGTGTSGSRR
ncbi:Diphthamide biosynthesis protein 4 [Daldinia childiae]|uniref:Diphthamide biosynthesis protein 4 n=1 Tax=Daldinia childiae TaxID=326645 RepID=UPI00144591AB|nr:Diphthamide biosynthesis protein 4 [Daldinia childiae]KAF3061456.1 Diphthamide biosynthesis protein 4 [Daldinia childiae]